MKENIVKIKPRDKKYNIVRFDYNKRFSKYPKSVIYPKNIYQLLTTFEAIKKDKFCIRSGGHSYEGYSILNNGYVIDISCLNNIDVDVKNKIATIEAGCTLGEIYDTLWQYGMTISAGSCPSVGIAGLVLGGGFGLLSRKYGLTCDSVIQFDMINWKGELIHVDKDSKEHNDLFWALCGGGGGNFGLLTRIKIKLIPVHTVSIYQIQWCWKDIKDVINVYQKWAPYVDSNLTTILKLNSSKNGTIMSEGQYLGSASSLRKLLKPLLSVGSPFDIQITTKSFIDAVNFFGGRHTYHYSNNLNRFKNTSAYVYEPLSSSVINKLIYYLDIAPSENCLVQFDAYGGFVSSILPKKTAFYHRQALINIQYQAYWSHKKDDTSHIDWINKFRYVMSKFTQGAYINYIDRNISLEEYYGSNYTTLKKIKTKYDPKNIFNFPMSIPIVL